MTCKDAVKEATEGQAGAGRIRSAGNGSKAERWYAWAWLGTHLLAAHSLLVRPSPEDRRAGVPLLLHSRRPAPVQGQG